MRFNLIFLLLVVLAAIVVAFPFENESDELVEGKKQN
jgi:hypothetical protein